MRNERLAAVRPDAASAGRAVAANAEMELRIRALRQITTPAGKRGSELQPVDGTPDGKARLAGDVPRCPFLDPASMRRDRVPHEGPLRHA